MLNLKTKLKYSYISVRKDGFINPIVENTILKYFTKSNIQNADIVFVPITNDGWFEFNDDLEQILSGKRIVILDYMEYNWNIQNINLIFGFNASELIKMHNLNTEYLKVDAFCISKINDIHCYFKRELLQYEDTVFKIFPIEFINDNKHFTYEIDSLEKYKNRDIDISWIWGFSHPDRVTAHANLMRDHCVYGYAFGTDVEDLKHLTGKKVMLLMQPHYRRLDIHTMYDIQKRSKIVLSMSGAGIKCFRDAEANVNSLMAKNNNNVLWSYKWDSSNSLSFDVNTITSDLWNKLADVDGLYQLYVNSVQNSKKYNIKYYIQDYLINTIENL